MKYKLLENGIEIEGKDDFNPQHILECGQIFSYYKKEKQNKDDKIEIDNKIAHEKASSSFKQQNLQVYDEWVVFSADKKAEIFEKENGFFIATEDASYFENFFDLKTDYSSLKKQLSSHEILREPIKFGSGIRILKQNLFETLISFIVSANNNIKRIQLIIKRMREKFGTKMGDFYAFPTREQLMKAKVEDFTAMGAGYRDKYLFKVLRQVDENVLQDWQTFPTEELRKKLISLAGVGPKVADCVLLFGFGRSDVFPVDTWIEKMYHKFYGDESEMNRERIRQKLTDKFGLLSGYAQQYLFFFMRSGEEKE